MKFNHRFEIEINLDEAKKRFVNRAYNKIFSIFFSALQKIEQDSIHIEIVSSLGRRYLPNQNLATQIGDDFYHNLQALETFYKLIDRDDRHFLDSIIKSLLNESEVDLGVRWTKGRFIKSGADLLDNKLANDVLHWLRGRKYTSVIIPFEKGLSHFLHSEKRPELLNDVITDMYEALEALAKIVTNRSEKDLSANRELFLSKVKASEDYKKILAEYINYANKFRHAQTEGSNKPNLSASEVESFIYLTGLFIRLAIQ